MPRVEINSYQHQVVVDDPGGQRADVAREARKLWHATRPEVSSSVGFTKPMPVTAVSPDGVKGQA